MHIFLVLIAYLILSLTFYYAITQLYVLANPLVFQAHKRLCMVNITKYFPRIRCFAMNVGIGRVCFNVSHSDVDYARQYFMFHTSHLILSFVSNTT